MSAGHKHLHDASRILVDETMDGLDGEIAHIAVHGCMSQAPARCVEDPGTLAPPVVGRPDDIGSVNVPEAVRPPSTPAFDRTKVQAAEWGPSMF
jgi:hypothetical protein